jgi:hypothetical protein
VNVQTVGGKMAIDEREIIFDFGFSTIDESELDAYQEAQEAQNKIQQVSGTAVDLEHRLDKLFNAIQPLLNNLKRNPEKEYILWPDRLSKIEAFEEVLTDIYKGK